MRLYQLLFISCLCLALVVPADAWRRWRIRVRGRRIVRGITRFVRQGIGCKIVYGLGCPAAAGALSGGLVAAAGSMACSIKKSQCKRNLLDEEEDLDARNIVKVPFDADFDDYDDDKDGFISFDEFLNTVNSNVPLENPLDVEEPFFEADIDEDGKLSEEEFAVAPFDFGDAK